MDIRYDHHVFLVRPTMHSRQQVFEAVSGFGEEHFALAILDKFLQIQTYLLGTAVVMHRIRDIQTHLFAQTKIMLDAQTGIEDDGCVIQRVDVLLTKLTCFQTLDMNELVEVALHIELGFQPGVRIMLRSRAGLGKKNLLYHR